MTSPALPSPPRPDYKPSAERGALWDVIPESVESLSAELTYAGATTFVSRVDVLDEADIAAGFAATHHTFGHIDYLVNNAGPANATSLTFAEGLVTAAGSTATVTNAWLALGRREGDAVVNVSSVHGDAGSPRGCGARGI